MLISNTVRVLISNTVRVLISNTVRVLISNTVRVLIFKILCTTTFFILIFGAFSLTSVSLFVCLLVQIPQGGQERMKTFPPLQPIEMNVTGVGWECSAADVLFSSAG